MINVFVTKKNKEQSSFFLKRFNQRTQASGVLVKVKRNRFAERNQSKNIRKRQALRRISRQSELAKLWRLGKMSVKKKGRKR